MARDKKIALCYVRLSQTRDDNDRNSPERQHTNIEYMCNEYGWTPEWYEDVEGHKSGTKVKNRPGWLALENRMGDDDVVAIVANDLARLHRKGWRIGNLLDIVDKYDIHLVLAAPGKQIDFSTTQGRFMAQLSAIFDEWYAMDISQRAKDSINHRKRKGITVGLPPFGTVRNESGYLEPTLEGAWLLTDGTFAKADSTNAPRPDAIWRGYFDSAYEVLKLYAESGKGSQKIAYEMQEKGWACRSRNGNPKPFDAEAVRRVVANWAEYGGHVSEKRARERNVHDHNPNNVTLSEERAVYPMDLLYEVGRIKFERSRGKRPNQGIKKDDYIYPLMNLVYCAHCEQLAEKHSDPKLRTKLGGMWANLGKGRYRHKGGVKCGCQNRSVPADTLENEFERFIQHLAIDSHGLDIMHEMAIQASSVLNSDETVADFEAEKRSAIAKCRRRIDAARSVHLDGDLSREEYMRRKELNEREIAHWESRNKEVQQIGFELTMCWNAVQQIADIWKNGTPEDKHGIARNLFDHIVFDLDTHRVVDFRLKAWADDFIVLRASVDDPEIRKSLTKSDFQEKYTKAAPTGLEPVFLP